MTDKKPFRTTRPLASLRQGRNDWYRIQAKASGPTQVHIFDEVGYFGVTAGDFAADLAAIKGDIEVHLATPGGEVFDGIAIYNTLRNHDGLVRVVIDSLAASIGSVIAMAADPGNLIIAKNASVMIHDGFSIGIGNARDLRELADLLDRTSDNIAGIYADRTGKPAAQWREAMLAETWYVGQEAVDAGLADFLQGAEPEDAPAAMAATWDLSIFAKRPAHLRGAAEDFPVTPEPAPEPPAEPEPASDEVAKEEVAPPDQPEPVPDGKHDEDPVPDARMQAAFWELTDDQLRNIRAALEETR